MTDTEIQKQRLIGQQILVVRMMKEAEDKVTRGGFSFLRLEEIAKWMGCTLDDVVRLRDMMTKLDSFHLAAKASEQYTESSNEYGFYLLTFRTLGTRYIEKVLHHSTIDFAEMMELNRAKIKESDLAIEEGIQTEKGLSDALQFFFAYFMDSIRTAKQDGYDWAVIKEMLQIEDVFMDAVIKYISNMPA